jgi:hypothetical protein
VIDVGSIWRGVTGLALVALRSFLGTFLIVSVAGAFLAAISAYFLRHHPLYASIAAAVAVAESVTSGILLGSKRAIVMTLVHSILSLQLGRAIVRLVFERLGVNAGQEFGNRGGAIAQVAERLPLAQAESRLTAVANHLLVGRASEGGSGWLSRRVQARLLWMVQRYTLARFREERTRYGGVDLVKVRDELEVTIDNRLISKLRVGLNLWTALVILGLPAAVFAQTYLLIALLNAK